MKVLWQENGIVLTAVAIVATALLILSEQLVASRAQDPIVIAIDAGTDGDDEGDERTAASATVPLYGTLAELTTRAQQLLAEPKPNLDLLYELARQARGFRAFALADSLLARSLGLAPGRVDARFMRARTQSDLGHPEVAKQMYEALLVQVPNHQKATY
ncbi:MAG: hypothetical protein OEW16_11725, partial [Gammaproteobacteria bacterium]|nr:hypothetical protein [Gammaproteobacteria bacterium]